MKKFILSMALVMVFALGNSTNVVPVETAMKASQNFLSERIGSTNTKALAMKHVYTEYAEDGTPVFYRFQVGEKGFMIVSATDLATPVLAYSLESNYEPIPETDFICNKYAEDLSFVNNNPSSILKEAKVWNKYLNFQPNNTKGATKKVPYVEPLVTTIWDQGKHYNTYCPIPFIQNSYYDNRAVVGCVALTMANMLYYYRFPETGDKGVSYIPNERDDEGEIIYTFPPQVVNFAAQNYNYNAMYNQLGDYDGELSKLLYHVGVSVNMNYASDASGSNLPAALNALQRYFFFSDKAKYQRISDVVTTADQAPVWINLAKNELDNHRPIFFGGVNNKDSTSGHAWIVDGYTTLYDTVITIDTTQEIPVADTTITDLTYFHVNFGWNGSSNGYFLLTNQCFYSDGRVANYNFKNSEEMLLGLAPVDSNIVKPTTGHIRVTAAKGTISDGAGNQKYQPGTNRSWVIACPNATSYNLQFSKLKTKTGDKVTIYKGGTTDSPVLREYSGEYLMAACNSYSSLGIHGDFVGNPLPDMVSINSDSVLVVFTSNDDDETDYGFVLDFEATRFSSNDGCSGTKILSSLASITNPITDKEGNDNNYLPHRDCAWRVQVPSVPGYTMDFSKFDLKAGDFVDVFDANNGNYVCRFDINNVPNGPFSVLTSQLIIKFETDNWIEGTGFEMQLTTLTGVNNFENTNVNVYPNPATTTLNVAIQADEAQDFTATIVDLTGKTIYADQFIFNGGEQNYRIPVNSLAKGIYFLNLQNQNGKVVRKFIVE